MARNEQKVPKKSRIQLLNELLEDSKNRSYFVIAVTVLFFIIFMILGVVPAYNNVIAQNEENKAISSATDQVKKKLGDLEKMIDESKDDEAIIAEFNNVFPEEDPQSEIIGSIYNEADILELFITNFVFTEDLVDFELRQTWFLNDFVKTGQVRLEVTGDLEQLYQFISFLEGSSRVFHIEGVSIFGDTEQSLLDEPEIEGDDEINEEPTEEETEDESQEEESEEPTEEESTDDDSTEDSEDTTDDTSDDEEVVEEDEVTEEETEEPVEEEITEEDLLEEVDRYKLSLTFRYFYWSEEIIVPL